MELERLVEDIIALAEIPAPTFAEHARLDWLEQRLAGAPGHLARDCVGNLVWRWGAGRPGVLVAAHVDTVFDVATPLEVRREGDVLTGPGIGDNATAVAAVVHVVSSLLEERGVPGSGAVVFTVGEEGPGNLRGMAHACEDLAPEAVLAVEGHWLDRVVVDAIGSVRARVAVRGPGGHSWDDRDRPSAIHALLGAGHELLSFGTERAPVNIGTIAGGSAVNAIAGSAELEVEMRAGDLESLDAFEAALERVPAGAGRADLDVEVSLIGRRPPGRLARDAPLLRLVRAVRAELGLPDRLAAGSTDAAAAIARGIPALCLGITTGSGMHSLTERVEIGPMALGCRQLQEVLVRLLEPDAAAPMAGAA